MSTHGGTSLPQQPPSQPFLDLPPEVRINIYGQLFGFELEHEVKPLWYDEDQISFQGNGGGLLCTC